MCSTASSGGSATCDSFSPVLLRALEFFADAGDGDIPCLEALRVLKEMNADLKRKLPEDAPTDFIPKRLLPLVVTDGKPDRRAWECALLLKLQDDLRSATWVAAATCSASTPRPAAALVAADPDFDLDADGVPPPAAVAPEARPPRPGVGFWSRLLGRH